MWGRWWFRESGGQGGGGMSREIEEGPQEGCAEDFGLDPNIKVNHGRSRAVEGLSHMVPRDVPLASG